MFLMQYLRSPIASDPRSCNWSRSRIPAERQPAKPKLVCVIKEHSLRSGNSILVPKYAVLLGFLAYGSA